MAEAFDFGDGECSIYYITFIQRRGRGFSIANEDNSEIENENLCLYSDFMVDNHKVIKNEGVSSVDSCLLTANTRNLAYCKVTNIHSINLYDLNRDGARW